MEGHPLDGHAAVISTGDFALHLAFSHIATLLLRDLAGPRILLPNLENAKSLYERCKVVGRVLDLQLNNGTTLSFVKASDLH